MAVELKHLSPKSLKPAVYNPRKIGEVERAALARGIAEFGLIDPIVCRAEDLLVLGGHQRLSVCIELGLETVPVALVPGLSDDRAAALNVLLNNPRAQGAWDMKALSDVLSELDGNGFDATLTGFDEKELEGLLSWTPEPDAGAEERDVDLTPPEKPESKPGEIYQLGRHRLMCGDSRDFSHIERLMDGTRINVAVTSPPYASQRKYDESSGFRPIPPDEYVEWYSDIAANIMAVLADDGSYFCNIKEHCDDGQRHLYVKELTIAHVRQWGWQFVDEFCWKRNSVPGGWDNRFKNAWEPIFHFAKQTKIKFRAQSVLQPSEGAFTYAADNPKSKTGFFSNRGRPDIAKPGLARPDNVLEFGAETRLTESHSAPFPVAIPAWFIRAFSDPGDNIFDPFAGAGTTIIAAEQEGRTGYAMELSPRYCDVIRRRYEAYVSQNAVAA